MEHPRLAERERPAVLAEPVPPAAGLHADQTHVRVRHEGLEDPDRVAPAADAGDHDVGIAALAFADLELRLVADHPLEVAHELRERVRSRDRPEDVVRVDHARRPVPQRLVQRVLERPAARR